MARMKFLCDAERCIECNGCVTACKQEHDIPWGVNRRRVVTINDGVPGERSISVACMHCSDAPCMAVCPVDCFYKTEEGIVLHDKDLCIGCGYCFYACPFGAPQFPQAGAFGVRGKMDKCTFCAGGPEKDMSEAEFKKYGRNRLAEGKLPACAEMCSTKALLARRRRRARRDLSRARRGRAARAARCGAGPPPTAAPTRRGRADAPPAAHLRRRAATGREVMIAHRCWPWPRRSRCSRRAASARRCWSTSRAPTRASPTRRRTATRHSTATRLRGTRRSRSARRTRTNTSARAERRVHVRSRIERSLSGGHRWRCLSAPWRSRSRLPSILPKPTWRSSRRSASRPSPSTTSRCGVKCVPARSSSRASRVARPTC